MCETVREGRLLIQCRLRRRIHRTYTFQYGLQLYETVLFFAAVNLVPVMAKESGRLVGKEAQDTHLQPFSVHFKNIIA